MIDDDDRVLVHQENHLLKIFFKEIHRKVLIFEKFISFQVTWDCPKSSISCSIDWKCHNATPSLLSLYLQYPKYLNTNHTIICLSFYFVCTYTSHTLSAMSVSKSNRYIYFSCKVNYRLLCVWSLLMLLSWFNLILKLLLLVM